MRTDTEVEEYAQEARRLIIYNCEKCKGFDSECKCQSRYELAVSAYRSCIPKDFWNIKKKDITHNKDIFKNIVLKYVKNLKTAMNNGYGLLFLGDNGVGKTYFISYTLMRAIKKGRTVYYTTMPQLEYNLKRSWNDPKISKRLNWYLTSDFVAIDEFGKENVNSRDKYMSVQAERILKQRCDDSLPMLLATNAAYEDLNAIYGSTVGSVLIGKYQLVAMKPGDFRKEVAKSMAEEMGY